MLNWLPLFLFALAVRAAYELARRSIVHIRKGRLLDLEQRSPRWGANVRALAENSSRLLTTAEVGAMLATIGAAGIAMVGLSAPVTQWFMQTFGLASQALPYAKLVAYLLITVSAGFVIFIIGRLLPEAVAMRYPEQIAVLSVFPMRISATLFAPLVRVALWISNVLSLPLGSPGLANASTVTEQEIITMVDASEEGGLIEEEEKEMILSVLDLSDRVAREVMVPRVDIQALEVESSLDAAFDLAISGGHSRIPIYEGDIDHIIGQLYTKDLLRIARSGQQPTLRSIKRDLLFTVESKRISELLQELQTQKTHICVVVDEFGGTAGIVTVEDILEEIVGEIRDEYDGAEVEDYEALPDNAGYALAGDMPLDDVNKLLGIELSTIESDTLGGYIYDQLGEVPEPGATVLHTETGTVFVVSEVLDRRIMKVTAHSPKQQEQSQKASLSTLEPEDVPAHVTS